MSLSAIRRITTVDVIQDSGFLAVSHELVPKRLCSGQRLVLIEATNHFMVEIIKSVLKKKTKQKNKTTYTAVKTHTIVLLSSLSVPTDPAAGGVAGLPGPALGAGRHWRLKSPDRK